MDNQYNEILTKLMNAVKDTQMKEEEYRYFSSFLKDKNVLVFGSGRDSDLYRHSVNNGVIRFLENNPTWIPNDASDIILVNYTTRRDQAFTFLDDMLRGEKELGIEIPSHIRETKWDVVFVDSPWDGRHGRMQSIYESIRLIKKGGHMFIHDCDRPVENVFSTIVYGKNNLVKELTKLRHYIIN